MTEYDKFIEKIAQDEEFVYITERMIPRIGNHYIVSNYGRTFNTRGHVTEVNPNNKIYCTFMSTDHHLSVNIRRARLVLLAFDYRSDHELCVTMFRDGNVTNARLSNIYWYCRNDFYSSTDIYANTGFVLKNYKDRTPFDSNVIEYWAPIPKFFMPEIEENKYFISTFGQVWNSYENFMVAHGKNGKKYHTVKILGRYPDGEPYNKTKVVHRMVMETFAYFPECKTYEVDHIFRNKDDNRIIALRWCTGDENFEYAMELGAHLEKPIKYTEEIILQVHELAEMGLSDQEIANILDIDIDRKAVGRLRTAANERVKRILASHGLKPIYHDTWTWGRTT